MSTIIGKMKFDQDLSDDQRELVSLHGWRAGLALGLPVTVSSGRSAAFDQVRVKPRDIVKHTEKRIEPWAAREADSMEARVAMELDHLHFHAGRPVDDLVQVECGRDAWLATCHEWWFAAAICQGVVSDTHRVSFGDRVGWLHRPRVMGIPVVEVPDGGNAVLRPRWPETMRLVQGG